MSAPRENHKETVHFGSYPEEFSIAETLAKQLVEGQFQQSGLPQEGGELVQGLVMLKPDFSARRYFRVYLANGTRAVLMIFDSTACPEVGRGEKVDSYEAFTYLQRFFTSHGIPVPAILVSYPDRPIALLEDLGDRVLGDIAQAEDVEHHYETALTYIKRIQSIPVESDVFPFSRGFTEELYRNELGEFREFVLQAQGAAQVDLEAYDAMAELLAKELAELPAVLVHRDFHSWNLMVDSANALRVIDFQDTLLGSKWYDAVSLLYDRGTDDILGEELHSRLVARAKEVLGGGDNFEREFYRVLLQRDLKAAGRFMKLVTVRGKEEYRRWVPGTVRRIYNSLLRLSAEDLRDGRGQEEQSAYSQALGAFECCLPRER